MDAQNAKVAYFLWVNNQVAIAEKIKKIRMEKKMSNEELFEFTYENDSDTIDEIADLFKNTLSPNYLVKSNFCNW